MDQKAWGTTDFNSDILLYIIQFLCVKREEKETEVRGYIKDACREALANIYRLRCVCVMFYDVIERSDTLWRELSRHTRRSFPVRTPLSLPVDTKALKEFIRLDEREYKERNALALHTDHVMYGCYILGTQRCFMDYTCVILQKYVDEGTPRSIDVLIIAKIAYDERLNKYRKMVKRMDILCGFKRDKLTEKRMSVNQVRTMLKANIMYRHRVDMNIQGKLMEI